MIQKKGWFAPVFIGSMSCAIIAHASEPQRGEKDKKAQVVLERIQKQRTQARRMVPLLSAQYCAYEQAFQITYRQVQMLLSRDALSQEQADNETRPYQEEKARLKEELAVFGKQVVDCQSRIIQAIIPCLPSVEPLRRKGLGIEYIREWCWSEPYLTYQELVPSPII